MKALISFSKKKFLAQSTERREKYLSKALRIFFETNDNAYLKLYNEYAAWLDYDIVESLPHKKNLIDRYHQHLEKAGIPSNENVFLVEKKDNKKARPLKGVQIYLENIRSAHNVGSIVRTAEAFGLGPLFFCPKTAFIDHPKVKDTAMGCEKWLECKIAGNFDKLPRPLIVFETSKIAESLNEFHFPKSFTVAFGNEEYGCSQELLKTADSIVKIPLRGKKNSLNVANAFSIVAASIARQKELEEKL